MHPQGPYADDPNRQPNPNYPDAQFPPAAPVPPAAPGASSQFPPTPPAAPTYQNAQGTHVPAAAPTTVNMAPPTGPNVAPAQTGTPQWAQEQQAGMAPVGEVWAQAPPQAPWAQSPGAPMAVPPPGSPFDVPFGGGVKPTNWFAIASLPVAALAFLIAWFLAPIGLVIALGCLTLSGLGFWHYQTMKNGLGLSIGGAAVSVITIVLCVVAMIVPSSTPQAAAEPQSSSAAGASPESGAGSSSESGTSGTGLGSVTVKGMTISADKPIYKDYTYDIAVSLVPDRDVKSVLVNFKVVENGKTLTTTSALFESVKAGGTGHYNATIFGNSTEFTNATLVVSDVDVID